jgi:hypothetical protein
MNRGMLTSGGGRMEVMFEETGVDPSKDTTHFAD